jgi:MFS family permease
LNALWGPLSFQDAAIMAIAIPAVLLRLAPSSHELVLAWLSSVTSFASMIVQPLGGALSDHLRRAGTKRRNMILVGAGLDALCLFLLGPSPTVIVLSALLIGATIGYNTAAAAYQAMIPESVPREGWGAASGIRGAVTLVGTVFGLAVAGATNSPVTFVVTAIVVAAGACTLFSVPEGRWVEPEHAHVRDWHDFIVVFVSRSIIVFGLSLLMVYILFFFSDVLKVTNPTAGTSLAAGATLIGAIVSSIGLGSLSDRVSRKVIVALSGIPMALAAIGFALFPDERWIMLFAILFGLGYGGILSTGWALAIDAMPKLRDIARDLGIWGIAQNLPPVIAPAVGYVILHRFGNGLFAYQVLFATAGVCFLVGSTIVLAVRGRPVASVP